MQIKKHAHSAALAQIASDRRISEALTLANSQMKY